MDAAPAVAVREGTQLKNWVLITSGLTLLAGILQFLGFVTPWWLVMSVAGTDTSAGIWYAKTCLDGICTTIGYAGLSDASATPSAFSELQAEATIAFVGICLGFILLLLSHREQRSGTLVVAIVMLVGSGIFALVAAGRFAQVTIFLNDLLGENDFRFPASLLMTGLGGVCSLIASIFAIILSRKKQRQPVAVFQGFGPGHQLQTGVTVTTSMPPPPAYPTPMATYPPGAPASTYPVPDPTRQPGYGYDQ